MNSFSGIIVKLVTQVRFQSFDVREAMLRRAWRKDWTRNYERTCVILATLSSLAWAQTPLLQAS